MKEINCGAETNNLLKSRTLALESMLSWGSFELLNCEGFRKKHSRESERTLKITVVYKTQIWQDHQSVYRNTNTIMKRVRETVLNTRHVQATVKGTWEWVDASDIFLLCLWKSITFSHNVFVLRFNILLKLNIHLANYSDDHVQLD